MTGFLNKLKSEVTNETGKIVSGVKSGAQKVSHEAHVMEQKIGKGISNVDNKIKQEAGNIEKGLSKVKEEAIQGIKNIPDDLSAVGQYVKSGVLQVGEVIDKLEDDALPSFNKVIGETGLVIAGIIAVAIVAFKVV